MASYPYYTEPTHDQGIITVASGNAARTSAVSSSEGRLIVDAVDKIFLLEPNKHPLVSLFTTVGRVYDGKSWKGSGIMKRTTGNPEFKWFEDVYGGRYAKVAAAYTASASSIDVSGAGTNSAYIFTVGDTVKNGRTGEVFLVTAITDGDTIAVTSAFGTTATAAGAAGDGLFITGNVSEENSLVRNVNATRSSPQSNYTQIFKTTMAVSNTEKNSDLYGGPDLAYQRAKKGTEHAMDIERAMWFGEKLYNTGGTQGHPRRTTGGILEFITSGSSYVQNQGGPLTAPDMNTFLREGFTYGNNEKVLFASGVVLQAINEMARGQIQTQVGESKYGVNVSRWMTAFGSVDIVHNPLFVEDFGSYAFLLDLECFKYVSLNNRDTKLETNVQTPGQDGVVDQYITECGLERKQAPRHALLKGVTA